ncbi:MAG: protein translocase subunit SecF [Parachlamydiaceae bacterium]
MEKQKRWQFYLILAVLFLTLYNILPTVFYYTKPLGAPVDAARSEKVAESVISRVNSLEDDSKAWLGSFSKLLGVHPSSIEQKEGSPGLIEVSFNDKKDADLFKMFLSRAGALIPFAPAQLELYQGDVTTPEKVLVARQINVHLNQEDAHRLFRFTSKREADGQISPFYRELVYDRVAQLALGFGGASETAQKLLVIGQDAKDQAVDDLVIAVAKDIVAVDALFAKNNAIAKRYFSTLTQGSAGTDSEVLVQKFTSRAEALGARLEGQRRDLIEQQKKLKSEGVSLEANQEQLLSLYENQTKTLDSAAKIVRKNLDAIKGTKGVLTRDQIVASLKKGEQQKVQLLSLDGHNPYVEALNIDWENDKVELKFFADVQQIRQNEASGEAAAYQKEQLSQFLVNDIARASRLSDETIIPEETTFAVNLNTLIESRSFLALDLGYLAEKQAHQISDHLVSGWNSQSGDLARAVYPITDYTSFVKLPAEEQKLGLVVYAPSASSETIPTGFRNGSIYVIARGLDTISQKYQQTPNAEGSKLFGEDLSKLNSLMQQNGFIGYPGSSYGMAPEFNKDYIFELNNYYGNLLKATREDFNVKGGKRYAVLNFTDVEQRILTLNKIDDRVQEDLLKWKEEYDSAQVDLNATTHYLVPQPTENPYWQNFKLSFVKYFRGDDRKVLKWGLDLSGGKTVRIGLRDHNNRVVTNPDDLKQAVNELYSRINKMGVSERTIRIENNNIVLDFPGSQNLSASELIKASAMYFHIVNEKFSSRTTAFRDSANTFLQGVWNEAVVTNRKDVESVNEIAWQHLGAPTADNQTTRPLSSDAKILRDAGLRLVSPKESSVSSTFDDTLSSVAMMRGDDFMEWDGQAHPLVVVFHNYALEGSSLNNVQVGYDASEGNVLSFGVKRSHEGSQDRGSPRDDFYTWTSQFAEDKIGGTPKEVYTEGNGWRMAVVLNGQVVSKPSLRAALRDGGTISGRFSQREINQLAADLKAGSLSFTPKILSEQNVSPELGREERTNGIVAAIVAVLLIVLVMAGYYRFAGVVASCAVFLNILILWGVLQNIDAALTLPSIAGIVLTIGMAVDANVLVFERIREEFMMSGRIASAIQAGYRKAFSAIIDSNITTMIVALILIQFDSGPIKAFAVTLIIGIVSSMFTALFMTRYFFAGWVQNPKNKSLTMSHFISNTHFDFMAQTKKAVVISLIVMVAGVGLFVSQRNTMLGMDFTGGYSLVVDLQEKAGVTNYRELVSEALLAHGATRNDFQVRELGRPNQLRLQFGMSMEEKGHPFFQLPEIVSEGKVAHAYHTNPRLEWVVNTLDSSGLPIQLSELENIDKDWSVMSGQLSDTMRNNAIIGLALALLSIMVYIALRFDFQYAIGAVVGLVHDVVITMGILALFHKLGFAVQIDLQVIGAIMTIIGYSLNDTIIVFDRIREDSKLLRKMKFSDVINEALNVTLSRTLMTSGTTLLVLMTLVVLGGQSIFAFSLVMTIGVVVGTLSSLFIAAPVMLYFHNRELKKQDEERSLKRA